MIGEERRSEIVNLLRSEGIASARALQKRFSVSDMTIRRDLMKLEKDGVLRRVHGGAVLVKTEDLPNVRESSFQERMGQYEENKKAIGSLAVSQLKDGQSIFLDGSTTAVHMTEYLKGFQHLIVVTDSLAVLQALSNKPGIEVVVLGGSLQRDQNTIDGPFALENAERLKVDLIFFSCAGFDASAIYNSGMIGTNIKRLLIRHAKKRILLAGSEKYNQHHFFTICNLDQIDMIISDGNLPADAKETIRDKGIDLLLGRPMNSSVE